MSIFGKPEKPALESKKFRMTLISLISIAITPIAIRYLGVAAPAVVDQAAPIVADYTIEMALGAFAAVTCWYLSAQSKADVAIANAKAMLNPNKPSEVVAK